jgi:hypothetical protein
MTGTMTFVGMDVHARSTSAAAIDVMTGELVRMRFGAGVEAPIAWLRELPGPIRACYEAGPTGFGLYRAAVAAGIAMDVVAPGKTPRGSADRVKTDRKDAELLARCLLAGSLHAVKVPPAWVEAARELTRCHDACRRDLMNARHRVSKMLLRHGRVYPEATTWSQKHRRWLSQQQFSQPTSELTYANLIAQVDGLTARKQALALTLSEIATDERWWPTVARLRCFRGVDTLTALSIHLELGGRLATVREGAPARVLARADAVAEPVRGIVPAGRDHEDRLHPRPPAADRVRVALRPRTQDRGDAREPPTRTARARSRDREPRPAPPARRLPPDACPRQAAPRDRRRGRA